MHASLLAPRRAVVLLVEDEPFVRELGAMILSDAGYIVIEAANAADALVALEAAPEVELLFTDVQMPGALDGLALARQVHERWPDVRLLVASGRIRPSQDEIPDDGRFIAKPYRLDDLLKQVRELIAVH